MFKRIFAESKRLSGLITVLGALIVFLGTLVSSQGKDHFNSVKNTIDLARKNAEESQDLFAIRRDIRLLKDCVTAIEPKRDKVDSENKKHLADLEAILVSYDRIFWTVADEDQFAAIQARLVQAHPGQSKVKKEIDSIFNEIRKLNFGMHPSHNKAVELVYGSKQNATDEHLSEAKMAVQQFCAECDKANIRTQALSQQLTTASNILQAELRSEMGSAKSQLDFYSRCAFCLYIVGSVVAIYGQLFDKGFPKPDLQPKSNDNVRKKL